MSNFEFARDHRTMGCCLTFLRVRRLHVSLAESLHVHRAVTVVGVTAVRACEPDNNMGRFRSSQGEDVDGMRVDSRVRSRLSRDRSRAVLLLVLEVVGLAIFGRRG